MNLAVIPFVKPPLHGPSAWSVGGLTDVTAMTCDGLSARSISPLQSEAHRIRSGEFNRSKGAAASPQPTVLRCIIAVGERHQLSMLSVLHVQHHAISVEGFGMKNKARVVEIFSAGVALFAPMNLAWGQSCQCENTPIASPPHVAGFQYYVVPLRSFADPRVAGEQAGLNYNPGRQLPAGWPNQWGGPALLDDAGQVAKKEAAKPATQGGDLKASQNADQKGQTANEAAESAQKQTATPGLISSLMVRDPFSGRMVPTNSQVRWAHGETTQVAVGGATGGDQKAAVGENKAETQRSTGISTGADRKEAESQSGISAKASRETAGGSDASIGASGKTNTRPWSVLPTPGRAGGGPAIGGGTGGLGGGGGGGANAGMGGGNGGGGGVGGNGWNWNPETGGAGGATGGNGGGQAKTGVLDYVDTINDKNDPPTDGPGDDPVDPPTDGPGDDPVDPPTDGPGDDPVDPPSDGPGEDPVDPPTDGPGEDPVDPPTDGPGDDPVDPPTDGPGDDPVDPPTEGPGDDPVDPPADGPGDDPVDPPIDGPGEDPVDPPTDGPGDDPVDPPHDGPCDDLTDIPLPDPSVPDVTPDVPTGDDPSHCGGGHHIPPGHGDSPVVPEPGSIILLGIAGGVGGAGLIRRRLKKAKVDGK